MFYEISKKTKHIKVVWQNFSSFAQRSAANVLKVCCEILNAAVRLQSSLEY